MPHRFAVPLLIVLTGAASALARPPGPPPEAYVACEGADQGDACQVEHGDRTMDGTCEPDGEDVLACRPQRPDGEGTPPGAPPSDGKGRPEPPPEAFDACQSASEGDVCSVVMPDDQERRGTCVPFEQGALFCKLERGDGPPPQPLR